MSNHKNLSIILFLFLFQKSYAQTPLLSPHKWEINNDCSDEFASPSIDLTKWIVHDNEGCGYHGIDGNPNNPNNPNQYNFQFSANNASLGVASAIGSTDNSVLLLKVQQHPPNTYQQICNGTLQYFDLTGAQMQSVIMTRFGYYETNIKMPNTSDNVACDYWLIHQRCPGDPSPVDLNCRYSEIDIFEMCAIDPYDFPPALHTGPCWCGFDYNTVSPSANPPPFFPTNTNFALQFHKVGLDWQPGYIDWYIDDQKVKREITIPLTNSGCAPQNPCPISNIQDVPVSVIGEIPVRTIFDAALSGSYIALPFSSSHDFEIDYHRYYKKKPEIIECNIDNNNIISINASTGTGIPFLYPGIPHMLEKYTWSDPGNISLIFSPNNNLLTLQLNSGTSGILKIQADQTEEQSTNEQGFRPAITFNSSSDVFVNYLNTPFDVCNYSSTGVADIIIASEIVAPGACTPSLILSNHDAYFLADKSIILNPGFEVQNGATFTADMKH